MDLPTLPTYMFEANLRGLLSLVLTVLMPIVVGLLTKPSTPSQVKALGLLALSAVKAVVEAVMAGGANFNLTTTVYTVGINFAIAVVMYYGLLKPTGVAGAAQNTLVK